MPHTFLAQILVIIGSTIVLGAAIMLLSIYKKLFLGVKNIWLRRNLAVLLVAILFMTALLFLQSPEVMSSPGKKSVWGLILKQLGVIVIIVSFVFNTVWLVIRIPWVRKLSFIKHHVMVILSIIISGVFIYSVINYVDNGMKFQNLHSTLIFAYYNCVVTGLIYTAVNYAELERKRKMNEKELEVTRLIALKTKAELDALHSKVNPHFLYNALNSIADLSITDGKKARKMTVALADLFRYSINYSSNNYSTVKEEVEMAEAYLVIEKIRFEDQLNCIINIDRELDHYLVPRFILQPLIENAVKHGLKATGQMTEITLEIKKKEDGLIISVADNGPAFPEEMNPGYGVKSVYDKLELLFPGNFELQFNNSPIKQVTVQIQKLMKNEPVI
jgi:two-component system, LytTR family, sensor kinase